ncbi:MAG: hypothetical protein WCV90_04320 [Candidatus Woesearchaeota archaeon]
MSFKEKVKRVYEDHYKILMIFPIILLLGAFLQIGIQTYTTGDFLNRGVSLKGGSTITINSVEGINILELESFLKSNFPNDEVSIRTLSVSGKVSGIAIDSDIQDKTQIEKFVELVGQKVDLKNTSYGVEVMGAALGASFFKQAGIALLVSFLLMGLVVIAYFRIWIPSIAVIICAFSDIVVTMSVFNLTGMKLSTAGVAAFLMLIGYSIDTDILLTSRVLHRKEGTVMSRIYSSISTGMTMTTTTICVVLVGLFFVQSETIRQIMLIVLIGMCVDMIMTWIQNVAILRLYLEHKKVNVK